jgi:hypothetical protein
MNSARNIANDLLQRLLGGDRGQVPLHLAKLLEKSSPCHSGDEYYLRILPPELANLRLSAEDVEEITDALCAEVLRNPDHALFFAMSFTGLDQPIKTAVRVLIRPPRPMTLFEYGAALALLKTYLPFRLAHDREFVASADLQSLVQLAEQLQYTEQAGTGHERSARVAVKIDAEDLLKGLRLFGIIQ